MVWKLENGPIASSGMSNIKSIIRMKNQYNIIKIIVKIRIVHNILSYYRLEDQNTKNLTEILYETNNGFCLLKSKRSNKKKFVDLNKNYLKKT